MTAIHLTRPLPVCSCDLPLDRVETLRQIILITPHLVLLRIGLARPGTLLSRRWALTPPFQPYPAYSRAVIFCGAFPWISPAGCYPVSCFHEARTFLTNGFYFPLRGCPAALLPTLYINSSKSNDFLKVFM